MAKTAQPKSKIAPALQAMAVPIATLHEDPDNARAHDERNVSAIVASLARFGQQKPVVVDKHGRVVAGNGTMRAALELGWTELAVNVTDIAEEAALRAYALADNKTADLATWNFPMLAESLASLQSDSDLLLATGFKDFEIEPLLKAEWSPPAKGDPPGGDAGEPGGTTVTFTPEQWGSWLEARGTLESLGLVDPALSDAAALLALATSAVVDGEAAR